jgi:hypothetical protein
VKGIVNAFTMTHLNISVVVSSTIPHHELGVWSGINGEDQVASTGLAWLETVKWPARRLLSWS